MIQIIQRKSESNAEIEARTADVFISYSWADRPFVENLNKKFSEIGFKTWVDSEHIHPGGEIPSRILQGIEGAKNFLLVVSPDSVRSRWCPEECQYALENNKRFILIQYSGDIRTLEIPTNFQSNFAVIRDRFKAVDFRDKDRFDQAFEELENAIKTDQDHVDKHTNFLMKSLEWERSKKSKDFLLRGEDLKAAEQWIENCSGVVPNPRELHRDYISHSVKHRQGIQKNITLVSVSVSVVLAGLAIWARIEAENSQVRADSESSRSFFAADRKLEALVSAIRATQGLKSPFAQIGMKSETKLRAIMSLRQAAYGVSERNRFEEQNSSIIDVDISPDGELIASAIGDGTVKIWDIHGKLISTWPSPNFKKKSIWDSVNSVKFSPDGQSLAFPSGQDIQFLNRSGQPVKSLKWQGTDPGLCCLGIKSIKFSHDGQKIAFSTGNSEFRIQALNSEALETIKHESTNWAEAIDLSPDGNLITTTDGGVIKIWNRNTGNLIKTLKYGQNVSGTGVSFSPNGNLIASTGSDGIVKLWKIDGTLSATLSGHKPSENRGSIRDRPFFNEIPPVNAVTFSPDGQLVATAGSDNTIKLWTLDGNNVKTFTGHSGSVASVRFSPDGKTLISGSADGTIRLWEIQPMLASSWKAHDAGLTGLEFSPDRNTLATASEDRTIKLWDQKADLISTLIGHEDMITSINFSPDSSKIATSGRYTNSFRFWKVDGTLLKEVTGDAGFGIAGKETVKFNPRSSSLLSAGRLGLQLWGFNGEQIKYIEIKDVTFTGISFSPDGKLFTSYRSPNTRLYEKSPTLELWNLDGEDGHFLKDLPGNKAVFSPDGQLIVTGGKDGFLRILKLDGTLLSSQIGHSQLITDVKFSPDGQIIASSSTDQTVKLWSRDGILIETLKRSDAVNGLAFTSDSNILGVAGDDGKIDVWNLNVDYLLSHSCQWLQKYLENNPNVSKNDKDICQGVEPLNKVGNISNVKFVPANIPGVSKPGANYSLLKALLDKKEFKAADSETRTIMYWLAYQDKDVVPWQERYRSTKGGSLQAESISKIACTDLKKINELWYQASNGVFGFSVQKQIFNELKGDFQRLQEKMGWGTMYSERFNTDGPKGHLPTSNTGFLVSAESDWKALMKKLDQCNL